MARRSSGKMRREATLTADVEMVKATRAVERERGRYLSELRMSNAAQPHRSATAYTRQAKHRNREFVTGE